MGIYKTFHALLTKVLCLVDIKSTCKIYCLRPTFFNNDSKNDQNGRELTVNGALDGSIYLS